MTVDNTGQSTEATYSQLERKGKVKSNRVAFIKDALEARSLKNKGVYKETDAELVSASAPYKVEYGFGQTLSINDGTGEVEVYFPYNDPQGLITEDDVGKWFTWKIRWVGEPKLENLQVVMGAEI